MKADPGHKTIRDLVELHRLGMLKVNPEYQRGVVWSVSQRKKLIDSVFRGYPLPMIYLHYRVQEVAGMKSEGLEVIDGQQRIKALYDFCEGAFKLFDPADDENSAKFPSFIKQQPCAWAGRDFGSLPKELQESFLATPLSVVQIDAKEVNEVRDLFVRLQSGLPLNAQETRDAWPGSFTDFILRLGGKPEMAKYPGHDFFVSTLGMRPANDRGKTRQLAAQIAVLIFSRGENGDNYSDIKSASLSEYYYENLDFDAKSPKVARLVAILDRIASIILPGKHSKLRGHDAIHLVLLVDSLWDDYTRSWEEKLPRALDSFLEHVAQGKASKEAATPDPFWQQYGQWTRVNSDSGRTIAHRHKFYTEKMLEYMSPLTLKDPTRVYGEVERTILFHRQAKKCAGCGSPVDWRSCEVHHIEEHSKGGPTTLDNGALVHKECHPKGEQATKEFALKFESSHGAPEASIELSELTLEQLEL